VIVAKQQVCRYPLTGLSSLRIDNKVDQQYPPAPLCLHAHINQGLPLRSGILFTIQNRQSIERLLVTKEEMIFLGEVMLCVHTVVSSCLVCLRAAQTIHLLVVNLMAQY